MRKYAIMVVLDLDVTIAYGEKKTRSEIENTTEDRVRTALETKAKGIKVEMIRTKFLSVVENG